MPGVGKKTRTTLLRVLGSLKAIAGASVDELIAAGATRVQAEAIRSFLREEPEPKARAPETETEAEGTAVENAFDEEPSLEPA